MAIQHLQALELAAQGDWDGAHKLIQSYEDSFACMIHGYLHFWSFRNLRGSQRPG